MYLRLLMQSNITRVKTYTNEYDVEVEWDLTTRCNYACSYCKSYDNTQPLLTRSLKDYEIAIDYLINYFPKKVIKFDFLGGEPTLIKHWSELLQIIHSKNHVAKIVTNLSLPINTLKNKLKDKTFKNCIDASFHPEFSNADDFISKVEYLYSNNFLKSVGILMLPKYWDVCKYVYEKLKYTNSVRYNKIKNEDTNTLSIASKFIYYTDEQLSIFTDTTSNEGRYTEITYQDEVVQYKQVEDLAANNINNFKGLLCYVGKARLHITATGDVFPSACLLKYQKSKIGNIYKQDLKTISNPIVCPFNFCSCGPDIRIEKKAISQYEYR